MDKRSWLRGADGAVAKASESTAAWARDMSGAARAAAASATERIAGMDGPALPLAEAWSIGLGRILSEQATLPGMLRSAVLNLDRLGRLQISSDSISFDGTDVPWTKVEEIKFGSASALLVSHAIEHEIERLTDRLPPVPGRSWLVRQAVEVLVALCHAVGTVGEDSAKRRGADGVEVPLGVPMEVVYRRLGRRKKLTPGAFVTLVAALVPNTPETIAALARQHHVKITTVASSRYEKHAVAMVNFAAALSDRLRREGEPGPSDIGVADDSELLEVGEANEDDSAPGADRPDALPRGRMAEQAGAPALERDPDDAQASS
ncbi:hypothetical protein ACGFI9_02245 [Micromonospora sp. NPDC048930]|uniref:hypothetical protein n=1 Tax=Micromonospora sp. NPDC048930 TaxID=3364261 RepID=UPI00371C6C46